MRKRNADEGWKQHTGNPAGSRSVRTGIAASLAATLLQMSGGESGGYHLAREFSSGVERQPSSKSGQSALWQRAPTTGGSHSQVACDRESSLSATSSPPPQHLASFST